MIDSQVEDALKNNVCSIIIDDEHKGTGFLLNNEFIMTAKHVVENSTNIKVKFKNYSSTKVSFFKSNNNDVAILKLNEMVDFYQNIEISYDINVNSLEKKRWFSRGYPIMKYKNGLSMDNKDNKVQQIIPLNKNYNMELDFEGKLTSYEGLSGSPIIVENRIVGIMMNEWGGNQGIIELHGLSAKYFKELVHKLKIVKDEGRGDKNMDNVPYSFLVNRFQTRDDIEQFIKVGEKNILIKYHDDWDDPKDIIYWLRSKYKQLEYDFIKFDFSEKDNINSLKYKLKPIIEKFRKYKGKHHFKNFYSQIIEENLSSIEIKETSTLLTEIVKENKVILKLLKDDFLNFNKITVVLEINSTINGKAEELYSEIEEALNIDNIKLIIITNNMKDFDEDEIDFFEQFFLTTITKKDIGKYLKKIGINQSKIDSFKREIDKKNKHNDIKRKIWYDFSLNKRPIEGEKNAIR